MLGREPHPLLLRVRRLGRPLRTLFGVLLVVGGILGFLPILGFWMIPLGLALLSVDIPPLRRLFRRWLLFYGNRIRPRIRRLLRRQ
jgi:hypothetical protein